MGKGATKRQLPANQGGPPEIELTVAIRDQIVTGVRAGMKPWNAAEYAGVPRELFTEGWMRKAGKGIEPFAALKADIKRASAELNFKVMSTWSDGATTDPQIAKGFAGIHWPEDHSEHAARKAVYPDEGNAVALAGFHITIHLHGKDEEHAPECRPAIDITPEKPPPDHSAPSVQATANNDPAHSVAATPVLPDPRGERDRDPLQSPPGYFKPRKRHDDPDSTLN